MIRTSETIATAAHEMKEETVIEGTETKVESECNASSTPDFRLKQREWSTTFIGLLMNGLTEPHP
jgi:hypothetical protein